MTHINFYDRLDSHGDDVALILESGNEVSYSLLARQADEICNYISCRSLVFCVCRNSHESVVGYLACLRGRHVPALLSEDLDPEMLTGLLRAYEPGFIWAPKSKVGGLGTIEYSMGDFVLARIGRSGGIALHEDLALLLTTSGSTGSPKFVRQSTENIASNTRSIAQYLEIKASDRPITTLPMSYTYGLSILNSHLYSGASIILSSRTIMEKEFWSQLKTHHATTFGGVPYTYEMLKKLRFERMDLPSLKKLTQAGGNLGRELSAEYAEICERKGIEFIVMYGATEATARMSYLPWKYARSKAGSIGIAIPGGEFWLEDVDGQRLEGPDQSGELVYKGNNVTMGYAESYPDLAKGDENRGILRTGDMAKRDSDGFYYIVGRKKRFLKMFGSRINLDEVEQLLKKDGFDCACSGTDDHMRVFAAEGNDAEALSRFLIDRIGLAKIGFSIEKIPVIPRNEAGKTLYSALPS